MAELKINHHCLQCLVQKSTKVENLPLSPQQKTDYLKALLRLIADAPLSVSAPEIIEQIGVLQQSYGIETFSFAAIKQQYNTLLLSLEEELWETVLRSKNPLHTATCYAFIGNYIDFGAVDGITEQKVRNYIADATNTAFDKATFDKLQAELQRARRLVYLTDNCGEIVMDKLLIRLLKASYPALDIQVIVRGKEVLNDATMDDAVFVGLNKIVPVTQNGTGIAGTVLTKINPQSRALIDNADVIIAKGMGNFETLCGCEKNVYYMFLCKCKRFCEMFQKPQFSYMLLNEKDVQK